MTKSLFLPVPKMVVVPPSSIHRRANRTPKRRDRRPADVPRPAFGVGVVGQERPDLVLGVGADQHRAAGHVRLFVWLGLLRQRRAAEDDPAGFDVGFQILDVCGPHGEPLAKCGRVVGD